MERILAYGLQLEQARVSVRPSVLLPVSLRSRGNISQSFEHTTHTFSLEADMAHATSRPSTARGFKIGSKM